MLPAENPEGPARTAAVIDIGSNSVRMVIALVRAEGQIEVLEQTARPVRLGHDTFVRGRLRQQSMNAVIAVLRDYRHLMDTYEVEMVRAVATSAVREASNMDSLVDRIAMAVGVDVNVIDAMEQSRLLVAALREDVQHRLNLKRRVILIAEVGGGSTLLTVLRRGEIAASQSYNLGSVRMQEMLATADEPPERAAELLRQHIARTVELAAKSLGLSRLRTFLAVGGDARFAARLVGERIGATDLCVVGASRLEELIHTCESHTVEDLARKYALPFADAETLVPALLVYQALLESMRGDELVVSPVSMRDGLLIDLPDYLAGREDPRLVESAVRSAKTIGEHYDYDAPHAGHVSELAVRLFEELQPEHRLGPRHRLLLRIAGLLHDIGVFVNSRAHHKHSHYLIGNCEIFGLSREDVNLVAVISRYHRRSIPRPAHIEYMSLPRAQRMVVSKLAAILRVADALDRDHMQQVRDFDVEHRGRELIIYVRGGADLTLERRGLIDKGDMFEEVFGLRVRLEDETGAPAELERAFPAE